MTYASGSITGPRSAGVTGPDARASSPGATSTHITGTPMSPSRSRRRDSDSTAPTPASSTM